MAGVLSRNVEHSTVGARPLVRVYSPVQMRTLMDEAGFLTPLEHFSLATPGSGSCHTTSLRRHPSAGRFLSLEQSHSTVTTERQREQASTNAYY